MGSYGGWPDGPEADGARVEPPFPYVGVKQMVNTPLDMGPYGRFEWSKASFPGGRADPGPEQLMTIFYTTLSGVKEPLLVKPSDTVASMRLRIWQRSHRALKVQELGDDVEMRWYNAVMGGGAVKSKDVESVASDKALPGSVHYSRHVPIDPAALPTPETLTKKAPLPKGYNPPLRTAQHGGELELYLGLCKIEDGLSPPLDRFVNTGFSPKYREQTLQEAGVKAGCVVRVEYNLTSGEIAMKGPAAAQQRGSVSDVETYAGRAKDTVLDPDWYVGVVENLPNLALDFFAVTYPSMDETGMVGWLEEMPERTSGKAKFKSEHKQPLVYQKASQPYGVNHQAHNPLDYPLATRVSATVPRVESEVVGYKETVTVHRATVERPVEGGAPPPRPAFVVEERSRMNTQMV